MTKAKKKYVATCSGKFGIGDHDYTLVKGEDPHITDETALEVLLDTGQLVTMEWLRGLENTERMSVQEQLREVGLDGVDLDD